jgi:hypothetical protein
VGLLLIQVAGFGFLIVAFAVVLFVIFLVASAVRIVNEYERGVIFRLGRVQGTAKGPGLFFLIPIVDRMVKIDLRTVTMDIPPQDLITRDNVPARVNAVVYFRVLDPNESRLGHQPDLPDHLEERPGTEGPRRPAHRPGVHKRTVAVDNRSADGPVGGEGERGRG